MADLRSIPYGYTMHWKTPAEAQSGEPADCKAKAVALYEKMNANGAYERSVGHRQADRRQPPNACLARLGDTRRHLCSGPHF